jgi:hypothetical protein
MWRADFRENAHSRSVAEKLREPSLSTLLSGSDGEVLAVLGKRSSHDASEHPYLDHVGRDSFYGFLASHRGELFRDEDFTGL